MERNHYEAIFLPTKSGVIKIYIYGFKPRGSWGQVFATKNGITVNVKGYNRRKTIIRSLTKLNDSLLNIKEDH